MREGKLAGWFQCARFPFDFNARAEFSWDGQKLLYRNHKKAVFLKRGDGFGMLNFVVAFFVLTATNLCNRER